MADFIVPKIIEQLTDAALKQVGEKEILVMGVKKALRELSNRLKTIERVLDDAEKRRLTEEGVGIWLEKLEDITYKMEDVLDEWGVKIAKSPPPATTRTPALMEKVRSLIPSVCSCFKQVQFRNEIALKIQEINDEVESTLKEANQFNFVTSLRGHSHDDSEGFKRTLTTSFIDESEVYGRDAVKASLLEHLFFETRTDTNKEADDEKNVKVMSIVGVGGSGKTTLAQLLYNDVKVQKHFDVRKWVCVSDPFDQKRIAKALFEDSRGGLSELELESQLRQIKEMFSGKKFLIVLDDVWTDEISDWKPFRDSLKDGAYGSTILVTTRSERVAKTIGTDHNRNIDLLSHLDCWLIIKKRALSGRLELCEKVEEIGQTLGEKCKGLPLAAKILGGILQFKDSLDEWREVLDSEIWKREEMSTKLFPHFYLSYSELTPQLKRCFSYCAVFPKDTNIDVGELVRLWMAQGYLGRPSQGRNDRRKKKGNEYFKKLAMRSFFQEFDLDDDERTITSCKMHDIVHDFAQLVARNKSRVFEEVECRKVEENGGYLSTDRLRHVGIRGKIKRLNSSVILDIEMVRSLFLLCEGQLPQVLSKSLKSVRSLTLSSCHLKELPREIVSLIHLRSLDVSCNDFKELPESICDLHYLESLNVHDCENLLHLPERIGDLIHLGYLNCSRATELLKIPGGIGKLTSLRVLMGIFVADAEDGLSRLKHLNQLEVLEIVRLSPVVDFESAQLGNKVSLERLILDFFGGANVSSNIGMEMMDLPPHLQVLHLLYYPARQLPEWIMATSIVHHLTNLSIIYAPNISSLPTLGKLSSLEYLAIWYLSKLKHLGREFYGLDDDRVEVVAFPSLKKLSFFQLRSWKTWEDISDEKKEGEEESHQTYSLSTISIMPRLQILQIENCPRLQSLPHQILAKATPLKKLSILNCYKLTETYSHKYGKDWTEIFTHSRH